MLFDEEFFEESGLDELRGMETAKELRVFWSGSTRDRIGDFVGEDIEASFIGDLRLLFLKGD